MTEEVKLTELQKWRRDMPSAFRKSFIGMFVGGVTAGIVAYSTDVWSGIMAWSEYPEKALLQREEDRQLMMDNARAIAQNTEAIRRLTIPTDIFEISDRSGPIDGYCIDGVPCEMNIRVRRKVAALACQIVPGTVDYYYRNPRDNEVHDVITFAGAAKDVGTSYINLPFKFSTPRRLRPGAELCVRPSYVSCPGMSAKDDPIDPEEECFEVPILSQMEADTNE
ncbi:hypothetical protein [Sulfitobacter pontiacus]|uniref:hypothetical protein n=1 Tax=Sulfitobacter pontiacus TaxID=60137 RepID=UPI0030EBE58D